MLKFGTLCLLITLCLIGGSAIPDADAQENSSGRIDWVQGFITAVGSGTSKGGKNPALDRTIAIRAAKENAQKILLETLKGVRIDSDTRVDMMMVSDDVFNTRMEDITKGAQSIRQNIRVMSSDDGRKYPVATVELRLCLSNVANCCKSSRTLISALNPDNKIRPDNIPPSLFPTGPVTSLPLSQSLQTSEAQKPAMIQGIDPAKPVTGVIIKLEGRFFEREVMPVVLTIGEDQKIMTVYSAKHVKQQVLRTYGVVRYADNLDQARKISYIGDNALIIPAVKVTDNNLIVIGADDAKRIGETVRNNNDYLGEARVVISSN